MYTIKVKEVVTHNPDTATVIFNKPLRSYPGQFVMLTVFGHEEIPLSLSGPDRVTVRAVGETTKALVNIRKGEFVGIKGPMGRSFSLPVDNALLIAGGIGIAPLLYVYSQAKKMGIHPNVLYGERTSSNLIDFGHKADIEVSTDDGSEGFHGDVFSLLKSKNPDYCENFSRVYCCGPEVMLRSLYGYFKELDVLQKVEFALERYMRCGIGVCGSCCLQDGSLVCSHGPVFRGVRLKW